MLKIYGVLNSRASRVVWMALEQGLEFEHVPVVQASRLADPMAAAAPLNTLSPKFQAISSTGMIPVIVDAGLVLRESLVINLHLARRHGGPVTPADPDEESLATMWSFWAATECEPHGVEILVNRTIRAPEERDLRAEREAVATLRSRIALLERALQDGGGHLVGRRFTVADLNAAEILRYAQPARELFDESPAVADWLAACQARPAFREMMARRGAEALPEGWQRAYASPAREATT